MTLRWALAGGGTGGHVMPALAIAEVIRRAGEPVAYFGARRGLETRLVPEQGLDFVALDARPLVGRRPAEQARALLVLGRASLEARRALRARRTDVVVAVGGYASVAPALAARSLGIPLVLVNTDAAPGFANRLLARLAARIFVGFEAAVAPLAHGRPQRVCVSGVPVRERLRRAFADAAPAAPRATGPLHLLVFGGSQGARQLNEAMMAAAAQLKPADWKIVHQTGEADRARVERAWREAGHDAEVLAFEPDMPSRYREADLVLCRAGAMTVAELSLAGRPAVLVPLAHTGGGEQRHNAAELERAGAARVLDGRSLEPGTLVATLRELAADRDALAAMGRRAAALARPDAAERIVAETRALVERGR
jgi:UDP-N-acetylglucosamine--N-acetylmuramyl-(pentapeptide) pyrophosphoryl-undecaprenol N-acetylglucosamine transferase